MADESKYLEENYDGDAEQRDAQRAEDIENAKKMAQEVEEVQQRAYEIFEDECIDLIGITSTRFEELMKEADESDALHQYLVDGALLTCTQATLEDFILPGTGIFFLTEVISLDQVDEEDEEEQQKQPVDLGTRCQRLQTKLNVPENPMGVNGQPYATVKDTIKGRNIMPFRCNCRVPADRDEEKEIIAEHLALCRNSGVCQYLMRLNEEWDNMLLDEGKKYLMRRDIKPDEDRPDGKDTDGEDVEGITRTSVLFCKHGGLIVPLTSGQDIVKEENTNNVDTAFALNCTCDGEHAEDLLWEQKVRNAEYIFNYLSAKGWSKEAICGVLGNINKECRMNPGAWQKWENRNSGYGIVQWSPADKYLTSEYFSKKYFNEAYLVDGSISDNVNRIIENCPEKLLESQLDFLEHTMKPGGGEWLLNDIQKYYDILPLSEGTNGEMTYDMYIKSDCDPKDLALVFHACYERSGDGRTQLEDRVRAADNWYKYFSGENICQEDF